MDSVKTAPRPPEIANTVSLAMLKDKVQRREIGQRVKALRERSGLKQKEMAKRLHVTLRQVQHYELEGVGDYERCEQIAKIHWRLWAKNDPEWGHVSAGWIWDGKDRRDTPDVFHSLNGESERLARIEEALERVEARQVEALAVVASIRHDLPARPSRQRPSEDEQEATGD
jgi:transcriptional regulator with XRE-family HTH domain